MPKDKSAEAGLRTAMGVSEEVREQFHRQILSSVSHDLKTPLASIIGSLEVYERMHVRLSAEQQKTLVAVALQEAYRLDNFITNILDMARLENDMVKPRAEKIAIGSMIDDCITRLGNRLKGSHVKIETSEKGLTFTTDPTLMNRVVCLVLDNAVKYGGKPESAIAIAYGKKSEDTGFITVTDNGPGIPPDRLESVFAKYTRYVHGDQQNAGTGLGLSICREIMRVLGGKVSAANSESGGAVFTLTFPLS